MREPRGNGRGGEVEMGRREGEGEREERHREGPGEMRERRRGNGSSGRV